MTCTHHELRNKGGLVQCSCGQWFWVDDHVYIAGTMPGRKYPYVCKDAMPSNRLGWYLGEWFEIPTPTGGTT